MSNYLSKLNGWQRVFIFVVIFLYIPVAGIVIAEVETIYERKYSDQELNNLISEFSQKEKIDTLTTVETKNPFSQFVYQDAPLADEPNVKNKNLIDVEIISFDKVTYKVQFNYKKDEKYFVEDKEILKIAEFIQGKVDQNIAKNVTFKEYAKILAILSLIIAITYFLGFMIGWVVKGFRQK